MIVKEDLNTTLDIQYKALGKNEITAFDLDEQVEKGNLFVRVDVFKNNGSSLVSPFLYGVSPGKTMPGDYWDDVCRMVFDKKGVDFRPGVRKFSKTEPDANADANKEILVRMKNLVELAVTEARKKHKKPSGRN